MNKQEKYRLFKEFMKEKGLWKKFNDLYKLKPIDNTPLYLLIYGDIDCHKLHHSVGRIIIWPDNEVDEWSKCHREWQEYCKLYNL